MTNAHMLLMQHKVTANSLVENYSPLLGLVVLCPLHCMTLEYAYEGLSVSITKSQYVHRSLHLHFQCADISKAFESIDLATKSYMGILLFTKLHDENRIQKSSWKF